MEQTNKERFLELLRKVNRDGMDKLIAWLESSTFFVDPASAKYHGDYEGGLCDHSLAVFEEYVKLTGTDYEDEKAIITCLLHDICKVGTYKLGFRNVKNEQTGKLEQVPQYENVDSVFPFGHGDKSVLMISHFIQLTKEEMLMIRWHMGAYESKECWHELGVAQEMYPSVLYIHFADMLATKVRGI